MLNLGSIAVGTVVSGLLTLVILVVATKKLILPMITKGLDATYGPMFDQADKALKRGMSAMGQKSGYVRAEKALEKEIFSELLEQYPEIQALLEMLSPDLAAKIEENPEMAANIIQRYLPTFKRIFPQFFDESEKLARIKQRFDL